MLCPQLSTCTKGKEFAVGIGRIQACISGAAEMYEIKNVTRRGTC